MCIRDRIGTHPAEMRPAFAPDQRRHPVERLLLDMADRSQRFPAQPDAVIADRDQLQHRAVMIAQRQRAADPDGGIGRCLVQQTMRGIAPAQCIAQRLDQPAYAIRPAANAQVLVEQEAGELLSLIHI